MLTFEREYESFDDQKINITKIILEDNLVNISHDHSFFVWLLAYNSVTMESFVL